MTNRTETDQVSLTVCICTFRRPSVLHAIESVAGQRLPDGTSVRILVIDNDNAPTARDLIMEFCGKTGIRVDYRHAPGQNISIARNAALDAVNTPWLAFIDDDEYASSNWLANLLAAHAGANAVFGSCQAIYHEKTSSWIRAGDYHSHRIPAGQKPINTGYTSNVLIDNEFVRRRGLRFDLDLGRTGGEDTIFFHAMYREGGVLRWARNAVVHEDVVLSRSNLQWIATRRYRAGQVYAMMFQRFDNIAYRRVCWTSPFKIAACAIVSAVTVFNPSRAMWWLMRGTFHYGVLSYAIGMNVHEEYGIKTR